MGESPIQFECKYRDSLNYGTGVGAGQIITGEVLKVHVEERVFKDGKNSY